MRNEMIALIDATLAYNIPEFNDELLETLKDFEAQARIKAKEPRYRISITTPDGMGHIVSLPESVCKFILKFKR